MIITLPADKNFLIARVYFNSNYISQDTHIDVRSGYDLHAQKSDGKLENISFIRELGGIVSIKEINEKLKDDNQKSIMKKLFSKENKNCEIVFYWIKSKDNEVIIKVPFGFHGEGKGKLRGNGCVDLKLTNIESFIKHCHANWETIYDRNITYQYASEYFIDSENKQNGFSIMLRNKIKPIIMQEMENNPNKNEENPLTQNIKAQIISKINEEVQNYGLEVKVINYTKFDKCQQEVNE